MHPPYVITPDNDYLFRDGGMEGDQVSELVATELPGVLEEGGHGTMTASWVVASDDDPTERPRGWLEGTRCDAWIVRTWLGTTTSSTVPLPAWNHGYHLNGFDERLRPLASRSRRAKRSRPSATEHW